ncbi:head-tail connector protein [Streptococcus equinus]|uniref:Uncharacterized protein n=1 Tax=Streptococcus equinus TaxID=1335 RepID=A0A1G9KEQ0_STREI|nr:hypothetical protein [Streptococcus equinus]QBX15823.1 hypothetical protein Javan215_0020 [Streptococcus phage Javan215]SDL48177.1 hypothetical protein SAMN05216400_0805 [Streptococcus equinus]
MIISFEDALKIDKNATQEYCDGLETMVRVSTNNNFQNIRFRCSGLVLSDNEIRVSKGRLDIFKVGDTVEVNNTNYNDGLYTVSEVTDDVLKINGQFITEVSTQAILTKISYPADVLAGVKKLIQYDSKMSGKIGVKSESISRHSVTYYDVTAAESQEGYPATLLGFLKKYKKLRWS